MENTIKTLALLKATLDHHPDIQDYIDIFIPFLVTLIKRKNITDLKNIQVLCDEFKFEYGLSIPHHPMVTIINRFIALGYGTAISPVEYSPVFDKIDTDNFMDEATKQEKKYSTLISSFMSFSYQKHKITISQEEASRNLIRLLEEHDIEIVFAGNKSDSILPAIEKSEIGVNLAYDFVRSTYESDLPEFDVIADIAFGHIIANSILIGTNLVKNVNYNKVNYVLDTGILFGLFGINGDYEKKVYDEFIRVIKAINGSVYIFNHTLDEFISIIESCKNWLDNPNFDPNKANRALIRFKSIGYHNTNIDIFLAKVPKVLSSYGIVPINTPDPNLNNEHHISDADFQKMLIDIYKKNDSLFDEEQKETTIYLDVKSVSSVFKLRKGIYPRSLGECSHIFVTRNSTLAYASRIFEKSLSTSDRFYIPTTVTDVFIGTMIWLSSPLKCDLQNISKSRLIASCYAALHPSKQLKKQFLLEVEKAEKDNLISSDEVIVLRTSNIAVEMLQEKTLGNPDKITPKTPYEIINEIKARAKIETRKEYDEIRKSLELKKEEIEKNLVLKNLELEEKDIVIKENQLKLQKEIEKRELIVHTVTKNLSTRANRQSWLVISILVLILICINLIPSTSFPIIANQTIKTILNILFAVSSVFTFVFNLNLGKLRSKYLSWILDKELKSMGIYQLVNRDDE